MSTLTNGVAVSDLGVGPGERPRFMSEADCRDIAERLGLFAKGGGYTTVRIGSWWTGNIRWARNQVSTSGDVRNNYVAVTRNLNGSVNNLVLINDTSDPALVAAARRAERLGRITGERPQSDLVSRYPLEPFTAPKLFSEATYQLDHERRASAARHLAQSAADAGMLSAGYIEVSAHSVALIDTLGRSWYFPYTQAQYSVTVRDPKGTGSGWAGVDNYDWSKIDGEKLSTLALDKCVKSRNPVAIEPGRYTTILEPQAVCDFIGRLVIGGGLRRVSNEQRYYQGTAFWKSPGFSKLGDRVIDERITVSSDPMDPDMGFPPFNIWNNHSSENLFADDVYHPVKWIENGVLTNLEYERSYGLGSLMKNTGLPNPYAFRMSGGETSVEEMISTTTRGLLVTRFDRVEELESASILCRGSTRDGLWLIEKGKISKPVKNMTFTESVLFALNNVDQLGVPQRTFHPAYPIFFAFPQPVIVPPMKIRDFSFTALDDAV